jgi:hypothetical protein
MTRCALPRPARWRVVWAVNADDVRKVRESRWAGVDEDVMSGVRVWSVKWMESVGCFDGRFVILRRGAEERT